MREQILDLAGVQTTVTHRAGVGHFALVMLHGHAMDPEQLAPFAHSLSLPGTFLFPRGLYPARWGGHSWWPVDIDARLRSLRAGPRDFYAAFPPERPQARERLALFFAAVRELIGDLPLVVAGFSQGAMLACDLVLHDVVTPKGLVLLSGSRVAFSEWLPRSERLAGLPVLIAHGQADRDLALSAGEQLRDWLQASGAQVTWKAFEGGHEIPLAVWRELRTFLRKLTEPRITHSTPC